METEIKRGPGRPRKTHEEPMDIVVKAAAEPKPEAAAPKLYTFKMLRGTNFIAPIKIIDLDEDGNWLEPRDSKQGEEHGPHTKVWPDTIVMVDGKTAAHFDKHGIGKRIDKYE